MDLNISYVRGKIDYAFECSESTKCEFCLNPTKGKECEYKSFGYCEGIDAQIDVLQEVRDKISALIKELEECDEELTRNPRKFKSNQIPTANHLAKTATSTKNTATAQTSEKSGLLRRKRT